MAFDDRRWRHFIVVQGGNMLGTRQNGGKLATISMSKMRRTHVAQLCVPKRGTRRVK